MVDKKRREDEMEGTEEAAEVVQQTSIIGPFSTEQLAWGKRDHSEEWKIQLTRR